MTGESTRHVTLLMPEPHADLDGIQSDIDLMVGPYTRVEVVNRHGDTEIRDIAERVTVDHSFGDLNLVNFGDAEVRVGHGNGTIDGSSGSLEANGAHGSLTISNIAQNVTTRAGHTKVKVTEVGGDVDLKTSFDTLVAEQIHGSARLENAHDSIRAYVDGNVSGSNRFGRTEITTGGTESVFSSSHGDLEWTVLNPAFERVELKTSFDDLDVCLPSGLEPCIEMETSFGDTHCTVPARDLSHQRVKLENSHGDISVREN